MICICILVRIVETKVEVFVTTVDAVLISLVVASLYSLASLELSTKSKAIFNKQSRVRLPSSAHRQHGVRLRTAGVEEESRAERPERRQGRRPQTRTTAAAHAPDAAHRRNGPVGANINTPFSVSVNFQKSVLFS